MCVSRVFGSVSRFGSLFVVGDLSLLGASCASRRVSVAGSRKIDSASSDWLRQMVDYLYPNNILVSGLALGADSVAHHHALEIGVPQIAVLPSGFDHITPRSNLQLARDIVASGGCLVSELAPGRGASRSTYISRNKIIAELGSCLVVPQFAVRSGTRHTVDFARGLGRSIVVRASNASGNQFIINSSDYQTIAK